jgi:hypothetical protein
VAVSELSLIRRGYAAARRDAKASLERLGQDEIASTIGSELSRREQDLKELEGDAGTLTFDYYELGLLASAADIAEDVLRQDLIKLELKGRAAEIMERCRTNLRRFQRLFQDRQYELFLESRCAEFAQG